MISPGMISRVHSAILQVAACGDLLGRIDAVGCEVEADVVTSAEKPDIRLVGLADKAVQESVSRIQAALRNSGYRWSWPPGRAALKAQPAAREDRRRESRRVVCMARS